MEHFHSPEAAPIRDIYTTEDERLLVTETRDFINTLDENTLRGIFGRELRLSGIQDPGEVLDEKFIPFDRVVVDGAQEGTTLGSFNHTRGIKLNPKAIGVSAETSALFARSSSIGTLAGLYQKLDLIESEQEQSGIKRFLTSNEVSKLYRMSKIFNDIKKIRSSRIMNEQLVKKLFTKLETIHTLVHEELHALSSFNDWEEYQNGSIEEGSTSLSTIRSGLSESSLLLAHKPWEVIPATREKQQRFTGLNEGITELHARRLSTEYLQSELPDEIFGTDVTSFYSLIEIGSYNRERWVAEQLVLLLSVIAEVPTDVVERSLFKSYLDSGEILPEEMIVTLKNQIPTLTKTEIEQLLLKLQIAISSQSFNEDDTDVNRIFIELADLLPPEKRDTIKDGLETLFYKYSFSKELKDGIETK